MLTLHGKSHATVHVIIAGMKDYVMWDETPHEDMRLLTVPLPGFDRVMRFKPATWMIA